MTRSKGPLAGTPFVDAIAAALAVQEVNAAMGVIVAAPTRFHFAIGEAVLDASGTPEYLTGAALDVTERKTAEERLVEADCPCEVMPSRSQIGCTFGKT